MAKQLLLTVALIFQTLVPTTLKAQLSVDLRGQVCCMHFKAFKGLQPQFNAFCPQVKSRVIQTKYGRVQGFGARVGRDASQQRYVEVFLGLPYASPPVGNKR